VIHYTSDIQDAVSTKLWGVARRLDAHLEVKGVEELKEFLRAKKEKRRYKNRRERAKRVRLHLKAIAEGRFTDVYRKLYSFVVAKFGRFGA
jgi:hypothetical protein